METGARPDNARRSGLRCPQQLSPAATPAPIETDEPPGRAIGPPPITAPRVSRLHDSLAIRSMIQIHASKIRTATCYVRVRAREWLSRSMIAVEAPRWRGATKAHTAGM